MSVRVTSDTITVAPAAGVTTQTRALPLRRDQEFGLVADAVLLDVYVWHEGQPFELTISGNDNTAAAKRILYFAAIAAHVAGAAGTLVTIRCPWNFAYVAIKNTGAAPATNFEVKVSAQTL